MAMENPQWSTELVAATENLISSYAVNQQMMDKWYTAFLREAGSRAPGLFGSDPGFLDGLKRSIAEFNAVKSTFDVTLALIVPTS